MILTTLAQQCAPMVAPQTMAAIVRVESGGDPLAMWNNTTRQRILPRSLTAARAYLKRAIDLGQKVDVGLAQVDTENFAAFGLTPQNAFQACTNLHAGGEILQADYQKAVLRYGPGQYALYHAFEAYNSGHLWGDAHYANAVLRSAGIPVLVTAGSLAYRPRASAPLVFSVSWTKHSLPQKRSNPTGSAAYDFRW
ncbi:lytic transglycosylase domain-containing protein [Acidithiobacillus sp. YTS05]|nr:lytic transglycosylase domain-containing protein [Acidithiobacillus sp. YTS05]